MGAKVKMKASIRPVSIAVTEDSINAVIAFCKNHIKEGPLQLKKNESKNKDSAAGSKKSFSMPVDTCPSIIGKVTWQASHTAWCVHGKNANGEKFAKRCKLNLLKPQKRFLASGGLAPAQGEDDTKKSFHDARRTAYLEAIKMWNEEDCSSRERIVEPEA